MPELPDVERFKRHLDAEALGRAVARARVNDARILHDVSSRAFARRLAGARLAASRRHGKHLLVRLDGRGWLTLHFGMSGGLQYFSDEADEPPFDRIRFDFVEGGHLAYTSRRMLGRVGLAEDADAFIRAEALGPDALDPAFDRAAFARALGSGRRALKAALMDQSTMAGIGNIYSDEILFQARLHPATRTDALTARQLATLFAQIRKVLETAVARGAGSEDFLDRLPRGYLLPHREKGGRCPRCGETIRPLKLAGRTGYLCPRCQPEPS